MSQKAINRLVALGVFLAAAVVYIKTLSVTVVFWDVGEFCAASWLLQVPHPPGSPLFILIARIASMLPYFADIAARMHAVSSMGSALAIGIMYLVGVKVITHFRGEPGTTLDRVIVYGASAIAALTLAFTTTYWDNSIEAEVYGMAMLFISITLWLALRWWEVAEEPHNEKYMLLIAYLMGLSVGVHLLSILVIFPVLMMIYFRRYEVTQQSIVRFALSGLAIFLLIYPGVVQYLPSMLDGEFKGIRSPIFQFIPLVFILAAAYGATKTIRTGQKMLHIACLAFLMIVLGYTTYTVVLMRSNVDNMPMNENNPNNLARFSSYIGREQYGETPQLKGESWDNSQQAFVEKMFPRRWSREAMHEPTRTNYTSDMDFLWRYQISHMFIRYLGWNFVGEEGDWQDAGVSAKETWAIPLLLALFGMYYHFKKDRKMASVFLGMFIIMGIVLDLYQNQQEPQPRERDYFYVGAYYCLALWAGIGVLGLIDMVRRLVRADGAFRAAASGILAVAALAVPMNLLRINWHEHDRSGDYIAWDYSYNLLQSCDKDALLVTNGDNDTFPLWYLQDVEGIRRDVRIVNLSLVNTPWYIMQLKNQTPHGAKKVPVNLSDQQIERIQPLAWKPRQMEIPVSRDVVERYLAELRAGHRSGPLDTASLSRGKITFTMTGMPFQKDVNVLRIQDIMVRDILMANKWERPVYFAVTCSPDAKIGLESYLWMQGLTYRLKPIKKMQGEAEIDADIMSQQLMAMHVDPAKEPRRGYLFRNLNNPRVYYDENVQRMTMNYRFNYMRLGEYTMHSLGDTATARRILETMEQRMPIGVIPTQEWRITAYIMSIFNQLGDTVNFARYAADVEKAARKVVDGGQADPQDAYRALLMIYDARKDYESALKLLNEADAQYPNSPDIKAQIQYYQQKLKGSPDTARVK